MPAVFVQILPVIQKSLVHSSRSSSQPLLLNALGLSGVDAITYLHKCQQSQLPADD